MVSKVIFQKLIEGMTVGASEHLEASLAHMLRVLTMFFALDSQQIKANLKRQQKVENLNEACLILLTLGALIVCIATLHS